MVWQLVGQRQTVEAEVQGSNLASRRKNPEGKYQSEQCSGDWSRNRPELRLGMDLKSRRIIVSK